MAGVRIEIPACLITSLMKIGYLVNRHLMVCIPDSFQIFPSAAHGLDRKLVDHKDHDVFMINGSGRNIRYKSGKRVGFYLIEPLRDRLIAKLDAGNLSGICNTDKNIPALCIGESGKSFNRRLIEDGFELDRFGFAFFYEIQDGFFVHMLLGVRSLNLAFSSRK